MFNLVPPSVQPRSNKRFPYVLFQPLCESFKQWHLDTRLVTYINANVFLINFHVYLCTFVMRNVAWFNCRRILRGNVRL